MQAESDFRLKRDKHFEIFLIHRIAAAKEKHLCPALSEVILDRMKQENYNNNGGSEDEKDGVVVQDLVDKALAAIFVNHYGQTQYREVSLNPFKTLKSTLSGMRLIYDSHIQAAVSLPKTSICRRWFDLLPFCK